MIAEKPSCCSASSIDSGVSESRRFHFGVSREKPSYDRDEGTLCMAAAKYRATSYLVCNSRVESVKHQQHISQVSELDWISISRSLSDIRETNLVCLA